MYNKNYKKMNRFRRLLFCVAIAGVSSVSFAQSFDDSGIAAGFFDSSRELDIEYGRNYSFKMDMQIIFRTLTAFVQKNNV